MAGNRGLGRGLGSLLGILDDNEEKVEEELKQPEPKVQVPEGETVVELEISKIDFFRYRFYTLPKCEKSYLM